MPASLSARSRSVIVTRLRAAVLGIATDIATGG
jgi:hypothetical protein